MEEKRAKDLFEEAVNSLGGIPGDVEDEILDKEEERYPEEDNSYYARLGILVSWMILNDSANVRYWLDSIGVTSEESNILMEEFGDLML